MTEKEDRILHDNVDEVHRNTETLQEMKIYNAMKRGIVEGKKREKRRIYSYGMGAAIAAVASILLMFSFLESSGRGVSNEPVRTSTITKSWSDSELFKSSSVMDQSFVSILDRNLIKPIYKSVEQEGVLVEVMGAVTDGRKVFVLYSVKNNTDKTVMHENFTLQLGSIKAPSKGTSLDMTRGSGSNQIEAGQTKNFIYSANLLPSVTYTKDVKLKLIFTETSEKALLSSSNEYLTNLEVPFELDPDMFKDQTRTLNIDRTLTIDGQKIHVRQMMYTPLSTYVDLEYDENNDKQITQLINPVLIGKKGEEVEKLYYPDTITSRNSEVYSDGSKLTLVFKNSQYDQLDSVSLKLFGIAVQNKDPMKIIVDINKKEIIETPGTDFEVVLSEEDVGLGKMLIRHKFEKVQTLNSSGMEIADSFTDALGQKHTMSGVNVASSQRSPENDTVVEEFYINYGMEVSDYPQPLTFTIERFWNPIVDTQEVELFSKN